MVLFEYGAVSSDIGPVAQRAVRDPTPVVRFRFTPGVSDHSDDNEGARTLRHARTRAKRKLDTVSGVARQEMRSPTNDARSCTWYTDRPRYRLLRRLDTFPDLRTELFGECDPIGSENCPEPVPHFHDLLIYLCGGQDEPDGGMNRILCLAFIQVIHETEIELCRGVSLFCDPAPPSGGLRLILRYAPAVVFGSDPKRFFRIVSKS